MTHFLCIDPTLSPYASFMTADQMRQLQTERRERAEKLNLKIVSAEEVKAQYPDFEPFNEFTFYVDIEKMSLSQVERIFDMIMNLD